MHFGIGLGDVEQTVEHVLEQLAVAPEEFDELLGVGFEVGSVPFGRIEDWRGLLHLRETL